MKEIKLLNKKIRHLKNMINSNNYNYKELQAIIKFIKMKVADINMYIDDKLKNIKDNISGFTNINNLKDSIEI